jgi:hypothetical protein
MRTATFLMSCCVVGWRVCAAEGAEPLPDGVVKAWGKAGAEAGWMGPLPPFGRPVFSTDLKDLDAERAVPAFRFKEGWGGVIAKLPAPARAFGLDLGGPWAKDAGLKELAGLKNLTCLGLSGTPVTDAGLKHLAGMTGLTQVDLSGSKVTDKGVKVLAGMKGLTHLSLAYTGVGDEGLSSLAGLKGLTHLELRRAQVTDKGLKHLAGLKSLTQLNLQRTKVTDDGVKQLRKALPGCTISR